MSSKRSRALPPPTDRRSPLWPWLLMPLAALSLYMALRAVRHAPEPGPVAGPNAEASRDTGDQ